MRVPHEEQNRSKLVISGAVVTVDESRVANEEGDMLALDFEDGSWYGVVAFYSTRESLTRTLSTRVGGLIGSPKSRNGANSAGSVRRQLSTDGIDAYNAYRG